MAVGDTVEAFKNHKVPSATHGDIRANVDVVHKTEEEFTFWKPHRNIVKGGSR